VKGVCFENRENPYWEGIRTRNMGRESLSQPPFRTKKKSSSRKTKMNREARRNLKTKNERGLRSKESQTGGRVAEKQGPPIQVGFIQSWRPENWLIHYGKPHKRTGIETGPYEEGP